MASLLQVGEFEVRDELGVVSAEDRDVHLEPRLMSLLLLLASRPGRVFSRQEILDTLWPDVVVGDEAVTRCVCELRGALGDSASGSRLIETIPKRGYRLVAEVSRSSNDDSRAPERELLDALLEEVRDWVYLFDPAGRYLATSHSGATAMGLTEESVAGRHWRELGMSPTVMEPFEGRLRDVFATGRRVEEVVHYPTLDGHRLFRYVLRPVWSGGEVLAVLAVVRQLEGRRRRRAAE